MKRDISLELFYDVPIEKVWKALTDSETLAQWLMKNDFQPVVGHKFQFRADPMPGWDGVTNCEVLAVDEPHRLVYTWGGGDESGQIGTTVTWTLEATHNGTRLHMLHAGFEGQYGMIAADNLEHGWKQMLPGYFAELVKSL